MRVMVTSDYPCNTKTTEEIVDQFIVDILVDLGMDASYAALTASIILWAPVALATAFFFAYLYATKSFSDQLDYTGNFFEPSFVSDQEAFVLRIRNYRRVPTSDLITSNIFFRLALAGALFLVKKHDPFVRMSAGDMDVLQPNIISGYSEVFNTNLAARQAGHSVSEEEYFLAVSYEKHDGAKSRKIRVIVATETELTLVSDPDFCKKVTFERAHHANRLITLQKMAEHWRRERDLSPDSIRIVRSVTGYVL